MLLNSDAFLINQDTIELMRNRVFELLEKRGVKMSHPEVTKLLAKAGAKVDSDAQIVRFPRAFLEEMIRLAPERFIIGAKNKDNQLEMPCKGDTFYVRTGTGAQSYLEPNTGIFRKVTISDVSTLASLTNKLDQVDILSTPTPSDVPPQSADVHAIKTVLQNTHKNVWIQPYSQKSVEYLIKLAIVASEGEEAMRSNPVASIIACALTPMEFKAMDLEVILQASNYGIPIFACSLPSAGGTAPITMPGVILLSAVEILAMHVTAQTVKPGTPVIATPLFYSMDMATGRSMQSSAEAIQGGAVAAKFIKAAFNIPTNATGSGCDSPDIDGQCMIERTLHTLLVALSGTDILGNAGNIEVATTISPVQLVIDNELAGMVRRIVSEMTFDDEAMAWKDLLDIKPGEQFLSSDHTYRHCRDAFKPQAFIRQERETWKNLGSKDLVARATELLQSLLKQVNAPEMSEDMIKEMDLIVKTADSHIL